MTKATKAKVKAETLRDSVHLMYAHLKELAEMAEECGPAEYEALKKAEQIYFQMNRLVLGALYALKSRKEDSSDEAVKRFLEGL